MKILLVTHFDEQIAKLSYIIDRLKKDNEVIVFADHKLKKADKSWKYMTAKRIDTHLYYWRMTDQSKYYKTRLFGSYPLWLKFLFWIGFFKFSFWEKLVQKILNEDKPDPLIIEDLKTLKPDLVIGSPLTVWEGHLDIEFVKAAKFAGIPTAAIIMTWDNCVNKTRLYPIPDIVFAWNEYHKRDLIVYHRVPEDKIVLMGAYMFEKWMYPPKPTPYAEFCQKWGLNSEKPIVTYIGSTKSITGQKHEDLRQSIREVRDGLDPNIQLIVRPHPNNCDSLDDWEMPGVWIIPRKTISAAAGGFDLAYNTYFHSEYVTSINSSAVIEAMIIGKEVRLIYKEKYKEKQIDTLHFRYLFPDKDIKKFLNFGPESSAEIVAKTIKKLLTH